MKSKKPTVIRLAFTWKHIVATRFWKHKLAKWQSYASKDKFGNTLTLYGGRYWYRTSDPVRVKDVLYP
jgi:hypothetical protein